jgi:molecular chaperone DnaK (HSP70)
VNEQGKRKTPSIVAFHDGEIVTGIDAKNLLHKKPRSTYPNVLSLLGRQYNDPVVKSIHDKWMFPYRLNEHNERNSLYAIFIDDNITMIPQDLVGIMLSYAKMIASKVATGSVKDCVISIPAYFNQQQRQAVIDAARLASLNVLSLINSNTAAALNWGIEREFSSENDTYAVFYDMGSAGTTVSLIAFKAVPDETAPPTPAPKKKDKIKDKEKTKKEKEKEKEQQKNKDKEDEKEVDDASEKTDKEIENEKESPSTPPAPPTVGQATVLAYSWDPTLGGREFDRTLAKYFQSMVNKAKGEDIATNQRVMAKLLAAAQKTKETLTANQNVPVSVDCLHEDYYLKTQIKID